MADENGPPWLWAALFGLLAVPHIFVALRHADAWADGALMASGFLLLAFTSLWRPTGFLFVRLRQLRSPRTIPARQYVGLVGAALLVVRAVTQLFGSSCLFQRTR